MANLCENIVSIEGGTREQRLDLIDRVKSTQYLEREFDFNRIIPYPEEYAKADEAFREAYERGIPKNECPESGYWQGGGNWLSDNWGTACNPDFSTNVGDVDNISFHFDTAWSPSLPVTRLLSEMYPDLNFKHTFGESLMDFSGYVIYKAGTVVEEKEGDFEEYFPRKC